MSRPLYLLSPLSKEGTHALPMITFERVAERIDFQGCDTLMFTSKQAVVTADQIDKAWRDYPSIAIGKATAGQILALGGKVHYQPEKFYGKYLSEAIVQQFSQHKILYLRPQEVSFDAKGYLAKAGITLYEQILYRTECRHYDRTAQPPRGAIIIFTSPSTIACFFKNFVWDESYTAVVIGKATRSHLPAEVDYVVAERPLIDACIAKAKEISGNL